MRKRLFIVICCTVALFFVAETASSLQNHLPPAVAGISNHEIVWIYKHLAGRSVSIAGQSAQKLINNASAGDTVTIPSGIYYTGIKIDKSLTVNLAGVQLEGVYGGKAVVNVNCSGCRVTINDLAVNGPCAGCITGNCAGIKMEGNSPEVTVNRAHIDNTVMGILTDNRGGTLIVNDSLIENTGLNDKSHTLGHGLYAGKIDKVVFDHSVIRNVNSKGHMFKSRAMDTQIINARLEGLSGRHSRSIDFPCGGNLVVKNSYINHGKNTDNADIISVGTEPESCGEEILPSSIVITDSIFVIDRTRAETEPAWESRETGLFNWRAPLQKQNVSGNKFIIHENAGWKWNHGEQQIPDQSDLNQFCETKKACGI